MKQIENSSYSADGLNQLREIIGAQGELDYKPQDIQAIQYARYAAVKQETFEVFKEKEPAAE